MDILNEYTHAKIFLLGISKRKYSGQYVKGQRQKIKFRKYGELLQGRKPPEKIKDLSKFGEVSDVVWKSDMVFQEKQVNNFKKDLDSNSKSSVWCKIEKIITKNV